MVVMTVNLAACRWAIGSGSITSSCSSSCPRRRGRPEAWDDTCSDTNEHAALVAARRAKAQIPDTVRHQTKWQLAPEMIDELRSWGLVRPLLVGDAGYGEIGYFRTGSPSDRFRTPCRRQGSKGVMNSRFAARSVRPANRNLPKIADGSLPECWLLVEWAQDTSVPTDYWLSTLPEDTPIAELVRLGKIRWFIEHVTAVHLFITTQRLTADPKAQGAA